MITYKGLFPEMNHLCMLMWILLCAVCVWCKALCNAGFKVLTNFITYFSVILETLIACWEILTLSFCMNVTLTPI